MSLTAGANAALLLWFLWACADNTGPNTAGTACGAPRLQVGNTSPCASLATKGSSELADNRIGGVAHLPYSVALVTSAGFKWMRLAPDPTGRWQDVDWISGGYLVDAAEDREIDELRSHGVRIMLVLDVWFPEYRTVFHKSEQDIAQYLGWVRVMVRHFKGRVAYYEVLNEPDLNFAAPSGMPVDAYVNLLRRTVPVIREEDPEARIVVGAVPDTRFDHVRAWMWGVLSSDAMALVDGFSWHGMYGAAPASDPRGIRQPGTPQMASYWENYPSLVEQIRSTAAAHGFRGEYLVEEMLWRTPEYAPHESEPYGFTDVSGAKYLARAIVLHLGLNVTTGLALTPQDVRPRSHFVIRALSTVLAGAQAAALPVHVTSEAADIQHYGFTLPNGERLLAIWTDGRATDGDVSIPATITFAGRASAEVTGIDVLHGVEQTLRRTGQGSDLVLQDVLLRDYPLILRLSTP